MSEIAINIIKFGVVSYISQKALKVIGQKDMAGIIAFCGWIGISIETYRLFATMYNGLMNSEIVKLIKGINDTAGKINDSFGKLNDFGNKIGSKLWLR